MDFLAVSFPFFIIIIIIFEVFFGHNSMSFWSSELKLWGSTRLWMTLRGVKRFLENFSFFRFKSVFLSVILAPKSENRDLSREAAISRERSEPQASRSDARARRARAKHGKAAKRPFRAAKRRFEPRSGS